MKHIIRSLAVVAVLLSSCQIETKRTQPGQANPADQTLVDPKYSLSQDRSDLDKLRESVPEKTRKLNDEKALLAEWMHDFRLEPSDIREKYDNLARKKRELFNSDLAKVRDKFSKTEKKNQEQFLKDLEQERTDFSRQKKDRDKRADFFSELDGKRKTFFSEQRDKRDEFESDMRDQRKNFEDYLKEHQLNFNSELKIYNQRWSEKKKN